MDGGDIVMRAFGILLAVVSLYAGTPNDPSITAEIAVEAALDQQRIVKSGVCESCNGTGKQGDGKIMHTCTSCGGTGKRVVSVLKVAPCPSGVCPL